MEQTPAHELHNADLLAFMPRDARVVVEIGCSAGALAREYKKLNAGCRYIGVEIAPRLCELARSHCDIVHELDIEGATEEFLRASLPGDCWVFGDALEHLRDPWSLLARLRRTLPEGGCVVACVPNVQHWSVQARLACGELNYQDDGLLDRTHLRWFTRITLVRLFEQAGFRIEAGFPRIFPDPMQEQVIPSIRLIAQAIGADPDMAANDAVPWQYVVRAVPA